MSSSGRLHTYLDQKHPGELKVKERTEENPMQGHSTNLSARRRGFGALEKE